MALHPQAATRPLGITLGDAAGIGPEIIVKLFVQGLPAPAVVYGDPGILSATVRQLGLSQQVRVQPCYSFAEWQNSMQGWQHTPDQPLPSTETSTALPASPSRSSALSPNMEAQQQAVRHGLASRSSAFSPDAVVLPVINRRPPLPANLEPGAVSGEAGRAAYDYLCHAIDDANQGLLRAIVTAPLNKEALRAGGLDYPGHTEILAEKTGTQHFAMMLATQDLRVILATIHIPLMQVAARLSIESELTTIRLAHQACAHAGIAHPRVAVAGLNPHAGEAGQFGSEEADIIQPAIDLARAEGIDASGPWPGDTIFMRARRGEFDIVVAQYHDQGLIPIKLLGLDEGVNVTVGLPFIRTSVDHGTAFDIAGKGVADPASLLAACRLALMMSPSLAAKSG